MSKLLIHSIIKEIANACNYVQRQYATCALLEEIPSHEGSKLFPDWNSLINKLKQLNVWIFK